MGISSFESACGIDASILFNGSKSKEDSSVRFILYSPKYNVVSSVATLAGSYSPVIYLMLLNSFVRYKPAISRTAAICRSQPSDIM